MPFLDLKLKLANAISEHFGKHIDPQTLQAELVSPPNVALGHVALPCYKLSKDLTRPAQEIAKELAAHLSGVGYCATVAGPYVNIKFDPVALYNSTVSLIYEAQSRYGSDSSGARQCVVLEYCSPNIAKKLAFQHIRSSLIGNTLASVYRYLGYEIKRINFVGDWGSQFARLLTAVELWGDRSRLNPSNISDSMDHLFSIYVKFHKELEANPTLIEEVGRNLKRLEQGESKWLETWQVIRKISLAAMDQTLSRMDVQFDYVEGESQYIEAIEKTLEEIKSKTGARPSEGAFVVDLPGMETPALIQKRDGTTLYLTRDIAAAMDRFQRFQFNRSLYVVSEQQRLHFRQLFGVLTKMGFQWADRLEHISFGTVLFGAGKMSTREGNVVFLDDLLNEARELAVAECAAKNPDLKDKTEVAEMVGVGAVIFGELSAHRTRDINFDWKSALSLDGETGPYVQYAAVRCSSLLEKAAERKTQVETFEPIAQHAFAPEEEVLLLELSKFRASLHRVVTENEPYHLTHALIDLTKAFNRFYYQLPVLQATDTAQRNVRLALVRSTHQVLVNGLTLLGIRCPKEM
ncbi:MAG: arginine--tRNA ligase [Deltaproteobacteria bacterium]|nr:arginine--tRNA ligase [Deltaproteobacteria bacterium]